MFTDVIMAYPATQSSCINLLYDIAELRKDKPKLNTKKEVYYHSSKEQISPNKNDHKAEDDKILQSFPMKSSSLSNKNP